MNHQRKLSGQHILLMSKGFLIVATNVVKENSKKYDSLMITNHLKKGEELISKILCILNIGLPQTIANVQRN
jgi:hypothetical protein